MSPTRSPSEVRRDIAFLRANAVARVEPERARRILIEEAGLSLPEAVLVVRGSRTRWAQMAVDILLSQPLAGAGGRNGEDLP